MLYNISKKYCHEKYVQLADDLKKIKMLFDTKQILYLCDDSSFVHNYMNHPLRNNFPNAGASQYSDDLIEYLLNIYETNRPYICLENIYLEKSKLGVDLKERYFIADKDGALLVNDTPEYTKEIKRIISREEVIDFFSYKNSMDAMYIFGLNGALLYINNRVNGLLSNYFTIPTFEEIKMKIAERKIKQSKLVLFRSNGEAVMKANYQKEDETNIDFKIYAGIKSRFRHVMIISENNQFKMYYFRLTMVGEDAFELVLSSAEVKDWSILDILKDNDCSVEMIKDASLTKRLE